MCRECAEGHPADVMGVVGNSHQGSQGEKPRVSVVGTHDL